MEEEEKVKQVEKIEINSTGIIPEAYPNNATRLEWLDLEAQEDKSQENEKQENKSQDNEIQEILRQNGINLLLFYPYDEKIVYALKENGDQLKAYMETCRKANYPTKKVDVPDIIPEIEYDLRDLKNWYPEIEDENLRKRKQVNTFKTARETQTIFGDKVTIKIGILLKAYFSVQELLQNRKKETTKALQSGQDTKSEYRRSLYKPEYEANTTKVSKKYTEGQTQESQAVKENEQVKEEDEVLAK